MKLWYQEKDKVVNHQKMAWEQVKNGATKVMGEKLGFLAFEQHKFWINVYAVNNYLIIQHFPQAIFVNFDICWTNKNRKHNDQKKFMTHG